MFEKVFVKSPKRARFDFSHGNTLSMVFGKLTPTEVRFIVPGDDVTVSMEQIVRVAPLPVPTFVNMKVRHDWFFVPLSMMYTQAALDMLFSNTPSSYHRAAYGNLTYYLANLTDYDSTYYGDWGRKEPFIPGSIHDYFNLPVFTDVNMTDGNGAINTAFNAFVNTPNNANYAAVLADSTVKSVTDSLPGPIIEPLLAYHYIWRDWYRFTGMDSGQIGTSITGSSDIWLENHVLNDSFLTKYIVATDHLGDFNVNNKYYHGSVYFGAYIGIPYYAYLKKDMFTSARYGTKPQVLIPTGATGTVPNLRTASALQKFIDIISIAGQRYWDKVKALWDETPSGMKCERAQFLGRYLSYVKVGEVITTATTSQAQTGDYAGRGMLVDGRYIFKRHFTEHGWLMCVSSIVPEMAYSGYDRQLSDTSILDTPVPSFANIGDQSVLRREIVTGYTSADVAGNATSFGDQFRYYAYKSDVNRVHGDFLMASFEPWTSAPIANTFYNYYNSRSFGWVSPIVWNRVFGTNRSRDPFFTGRFFIDLTFHEFITRKLPKYVTYAL